MLKLSYLSIVLLLLMWGCGSQEPAEGSRTFSLEMNFSYSGNPDFVYDHLTGDISSWWDHSFSENPHKLYIEARQSHWFAPIP